MTDCGFSLIELEMATSRDDQSTCVTKKNERMYSMCTVHRHNKKGINRIASPIRNIEKSIKNYKTKVPCGSKKTWASVGTDVGV